MADGFTPGDFNAVVQTVAGEGANQPPDAQRAIASTILNRHAILGGSIADIASDPSVYNGAKTANAKSAVPGSDLYSTISGNIAPVFKTGPTTTATHFHADMDKPPSWDNGKGTRIGDQTFLDRSDLLKAPAPAMPSTDDLEAHFTGKAVAPPAPVTQRPLANLPGYISDPANGPGETGAIPLGGPTADELEAHFGGPTRVPTAPTTPQQLAAQKDASQVEGALSAGASHLTGGADLTTPFVHGVTQGFSDELKGKLFAGMTGGKNLILNALGQPVPYGMKDADAAMTGAARSNLSAISQAHPVASTVAETTGTVLPWLAGGEALGAGKAAVEAPTALGRMAQLGGRVISGGAKGSALGAVGGAVSGAGNAEGDASQRLPAAERGAGTGAVLGGALGAGAPIVAPPIASVARAVGNEFSAGAGSVGQFARNALDGLAGRPIETTAADYFKANSPAAQKVGGMFTPADVAETVEPTAHETRLAQQRVSQMMASKGMHTDDLRAIPQDLPYTTAEAIGSQTVNHAASLARRSGTTPDATVSQIGQRAQQFGASVLDDFGKATGIHPEEAAGNIEFLTQRLKEEADPMFNAVRSHPGPVWSADLAKIAERPVVAKAIDAAANDMKNGGKDPLAAGFKLDPDTGLYVLNKDLSKSAEQQPTAEAWENVRQRLGEQVDRDPLTRRIIPDSQSRGNYNINVAKRDLTTALAGDKDGNGGLIPGYRNALNMSGEQQGLQSAFDRAQTSLLTDKVPARDFDKLYQSLSPAEQTAAQAGVANKLYAQTQTRMGLTPTMLKSPNFQAKIRTIMGDGADDFLDRLTQRVRLQNTGNRMLPGSGSQTTPLLNAGEESGPSVDALGNVVRDVLHAKASPGTFVAKQLLKSNLGDRAANVTETPGYRNAYGRILLQHPGETADELRAAPPITPRQIPNTSMRYSALGVPVAGEGQRAPQ